MSKNSNYGLKKDVNYHNLTTSTSIQVAQNNVNPAVKPSGNLFFNTTNDKLYVSSGLEWLELASGLIGGNSYATLTYPLTNFTTSTEYTTLATFIYPGTNAITLSSIKLIAFMTYGAINFDILVRDVTNNTTIGSALVQKNVSPDTIININTLSSLPVGESIFEILGKHSGGGEYKLYLTFVQLLI